jgi:hypothetical protein
VRRLIVSISAFALTLALPATAFAASAAAATTDNTGKPSGHGWTITSIFVVALFIPALLGFLTLIDIARGKHTQRDH